MVKAAYLLGFDCTSSVQLLPEDLSTKPCPDPRYLTHLLPTLHHFCHILVHNTHLVVIHA